MLLNITNCKNLIVTILYSNNLLTLKIKDDGIGFKTDDYDKNSELMGGNGIKGMQMRAREIKAKMNIESQPEQGCIITLRLSL
jgi:signal transduction histidine kinase